MTIEKFDDTQVVKILKMKSLILNDEQMIMVNKLVSANLQCNLGQADRENGAEKTKCLARAKMSDDVLDAIQLAKEI